MDIYPTRLVVRYAKSQGENTHQSFTSAIDRVIRGTYYGARKETVPLIHEKTQEEDSKSDHPLLPLFPVYCTTTSSNAAGTLEEDLEYMKTYNIEEERKQKVPSKTGNRKYKKQQK